MADDGTEANPVNSANYYVLRRHTDTRQRKNGYELIDKRSCGPRQKKFELNQHNNEPTPPHSSRSRRYDRE
eukprot:scaffold129257_cov54-Attheya_sp.AAC.7